MIDWLAKLIELVELEVAWAELEVAWEAIAHECIAQMSTDDVEDICHALDMC